MQRGGGNEQQTRVDDPAKSPNPPPGARGQSEGKPATAKHGAGGAEPSLAGKIRAKNEPQAQQGKSGRDGLVPLSDFAIRSLPPRWRRARSDRKRGRPARRRQAPPPSRQSPRGRAAGDRPSNAARKNWAPMGFCPAHRRHRSAWQAAPDWGGINHVFAAPASTLPFRDCPVMPPNRRSRAENSAKAAEKACRSKSGQCIGRKTNSE